MDVFVALDKIDVNGERVSYPICAYVDGGPIAFGWMRATLRELYASKSTPAQPVQAFLREPKIPEGPVRLDIEIWPFTTLFHAGETLRLTIAGNDIHRWPADILAPGHDLLNNTAQHIVHSGGESASFLRLPVVSKRGPDLD